MSEPALPLGGAVHQGRVAIEEIGPLGMVSLRGDLESPALRDAVAKATGASVPDRRAMSASGDSAVLWMSPDELMWVGAYTDAPGVVAGLNEALAGGQHLAADVSDARAVFRLSGPEVREVLARLTPADLHPDVLRPGEVRRTRLAQVAAAFWFLDDETVHLVCFRSVAKYVFDLLANAAKSRASAAHL